MARCRPHHRYNCKDCRTVLPPASSLPAKIEDLLTDEEKKNLSDDLAAMARQRRNAEAASAHIIIGGD